MVRYLITYIHMINLQNRWDGGTRDGLKHHQLSNDIPGALVI